MNNYLKGRVKLLRSMQNALEVLAKEDTPDRFATLHHLNKAYVEIRQDTVQSLSLSSNVVGAISFLNQSGNRVRGLKLSRYLTRRVSCLKELTLNQFVLSSFCILTLHKACINDSSLFTLVNGSAIEAAYLDLHELGVESCMSYSSLIEQGILDLYCQNPKVIELLIYKNPLNKAYGRALLWSINIGTPDNPIVKKYLEKPYMTGHEEVYWAYQNWEKEHKEELISLSIIKNHKHTVTLTYPNSRLYPYMDTFYFVKNFGNSTLVCSAIELIPPEDEHILRSENGDIQDHL